MSNLTLLIPAKYEFESLPIFLKELDKFDHKKIVILYQNDTETISAAKQFNDVEILFQKKKGYGNAIIEGINSVKRHQQVYRVLQEELQGEVHALSLRCHTPTQWSELGKQIHLTPNCRGGSGH